MKIRTLAPVVVVSALLLTGCTAEPEPEPTMPVITSSVDGGGLATPAASPTPDSTTTASSFSAVPSSEPTVSAGEGLLMAPTDGVREHPEHQQIVDAAIVAITEITTFRPAEDFSMTDAMLRAVEKGYLTDEAAAKVVAPERPTSGPQWQWAAENQAVSSPKVDEGLASEWGLSWDEEIVGLDTGMVVIDATWDWETEDGRSRSADEYRRYYIVMKKVGDDWKLHDYTVDL